MIAPGGSGRAEWGGLELRILRRPPEGGRKSRMGVLERARGVGGKNGDAERGEVTAPFAATGSKGDEGGRPDAEHWGEGMH